MSSGEYWKKILRWNHNEQKGITALLLIISILILTGLFAPRYMQPDKIVAVQIVFQDTLYPKEAVAEISAEAKTESRQMKKKVVLKPFDPNHVNKNNLLAMGLSQKQADIWINYLEKKGRFYKPEDVLKLYSIDSAQYKKLQPYIQIKKPERNKKSKKVTITKKLRQAIELNTVDSIQLLSLKGIGPYFAGKIIQYREKLGGFYDTLQVLEIWRMDSTIFFKNKGLIKVNPMELQKININAATKEELKNHPYISWKIANSIVALREQHGVFKSVEGIKESVLINDSTFLKIEPYLKAE